MEAIERKPTEDISTACECEQSQSELITTDYKDDNEHFDPIVAKIGKISCLVTSQNDCDQNEKTVSDASTSESADSSAGESASSESGLNSRDSDASQVAALRAELKQKVQAIESLVGRCDVLERSFRQLEVVNRTLEEDIELVKNENQNVNTKLLSLMSVVAKLSAASEHENKRRAASEVACSTSSEPISKPTSPGMAEPGSLGTSLGATNPAEGAAAIAAVELQLQTMKKQLTDNEKTVKECSTHIDGVDSKVDWLETELQRYVRRHSLIIENFCPKEDRSASEMFVLFSNSVLNVPLDDSDIDSLHLIDHQSSSVAHSGKQAVQLSPDKRRTPRPILVTFTCYRARAQVYRAWLTFRSAQSKTSGAGASGAGTLSAERGQGLCVREFLTEAQDAVYREASQAREKHLIADCWTFKGKTFVRALNGDIREFINKEQSIPKDESRCIIM